MFNSFQCIGLIFSKYFIFLMLLQWYFKFSFSLLLTHRNTNNFGILIFYPTILINLQLSSFNFTV